ncbi:hypothetical protein GCM10023258_21200 [Terrabacter aeriphilus]|uniref:Zinc finger protein n=1 Tax=Terrabacter aeriphilus TaxID=515662 RepID=A0ABP9JBJ2_9MICO
MTPHLKGHVRAYVDRALPPALLHVYDRHLVCCTVCRAAADQERRIVAALRADTGVPMSLRTSLMGLAAHPVEGSTLANAQPGAREAGVPRVPSPPLGFRMPSAPSYEPVPTVAPTAPALHRSPMRAAVVASIAAGASVAAAWGLAVSPVPGARVPSTARVPAASFGANAVGAVSAVNFGGSVLPGNRVAPALRESQRSRTVGLGGLPYWAVITRSAAIASNAAAPVRLTALRSAQSGP